MPFDPYFQWLQIPAERRPPDYYDLLGVPHLEADTQRIHSKALERIAHVRRFQLGEHADAALRLISELSAAFDTLTRPDRKRAYDQQLAQRTTQADPAGLTTALEPAAPVPVTMPLPRAKPLAPQTVPTEGLATIAIDPNRAAATSAGRGQRTRHRSSTSALVATGAAVVICAAIVAYVRPWASHTAPAIQPPPAAKQIALVPSPPTKQPPSPPRETNTGPPRTTTTEPSPPPQPAPARPPSSSEPKWTPIFTSPDDLAPVAGAKWMDGVIEVRSEKLIKKDLHLRDAVIRARVTRLAGRNIAVALRRNDQNGYSAWFNGGHWFGISKGVGGRWSDVEQGFTKQDISGEFELKFAAVGDLLSVWVDGELVIEVRDSSHQQGSPGIAAAGWGQYRNVEIQVLDPLEPQTPPTVQFPPTPLIPAAQMLFNGRDLTGWTPMHIIAPRKSERDRERSWSIDQQAIVCSTNRSVWLRSEREFGDFVLVLDFKLARGANSGILLRTQAVGGIHKDALEIQLIDEGAHPNLRPEQRTGALYGAIAPTAAAARPAGEWNSLEARCQGQRVQVTINGTQVVDADISQYPQLRELPRRGYLGLYNWRGEANGTAFRNITVAEL